MTAPQRGKINRPIDRHNRFLPYQMTTKSTSSGRPMNQLFWLHLGFFKLGPRHIVAHNSCLVNVLGTVQNILGWQPICQYLRALAINHHSPVIHIQGFAWICVYKNRGDTLASHAITQPHSFEASGCSTLFNIDSREVVFNGDATKTPVNRWYKRL